MHPTLIASFRALLANPDRPDRDALFAVLPDRAATVILGCLAPPGSLLQIATALESGWSWDCDGWNPQTDELVHLITDPRSSHSDLMIRTWSRIPSAVGVLRDRTDTLIAWAQQRLVPERYADLAILIGPSNASVRLLMQSPFSDTIGQTLRRWSMGVDPEDPTAWQAMIDPDLRTALHQRADPSWAFPAWGRDDAVASGVVLDRIVDDLFDGWSPDHPSIRGRIGWAANYVAPNLDMSPLAVFAILGRSVALAEAVCVHGVYDPLSIPWIAGIVPWGRLHARIQTVIEEPMQQVSDHQKRMWACAL